MTRRRRDDVSRREKINRPMLAGLGFSAPHTDRGAIVGVLPVAALDERRIS